ncbi:Gfo/Idh/MocA family oxidoreductase [Candidatus Poribacteria bacterium]|nr:Gfo/Idh/MocA family oxidoreductase [Candidatus Poribacteria bacterium]
MIQLAIVGLGYWGPNLLRNFDQLSDCEVKVCCDLNDDNLLRIEEQYPHVAITKNYKDLMADDELEAIVIATSAASHYNLVKEALHHHKHVFVEKPFVLNVEHATELVHLAEKTNRKLMVGHLMEYHPAIEKLKEIIQSGELGDIYYLYSQRVNLGQIRKDENALWSFAPHDLSIIMYLLETEPENVSARGQAYLQEGIEDVAFVNLQFPNKIMAQIQLSWLDPHKIRKTTVVGSKKMVVFDDMEATEMLKIYDKGVTSNGQFASFGEALSLRFGDISIPYVKMTEPLKLECQHFLNCIKDNQIPRSDGHDGLRVVKVLQAAQESLDKSGMPVNIL